MDPRPSTSSSAEDKDKEKDKEPHFLSLVGPGKIKRGSLRAKKTADPKPALNLNLNLVNTSPLATPSSAAGFSAVGSLDLSVNSQQMATAVQSFGSGQSNANTRKKQPKELVSAQVSKRISSASKDYQLLWNVVLQRLSISPSLSKELRAGGNVSRVEEKLMAGDSELSGYLTLLGEQDKFHVSSPIELLNLLIKTFHTARRMLTEKKPTTLAVVKIMRELDETLQRLPKLSLDAHVAEILGWWAPQIVEAITIVQLYLQQHPHSGSSSSSSSTMPQPSPISHVKHSSVWPEVKNIHQFVSTLACSTALSLVLLRGHYLPQDSFLLARISCPGANVNLESSEAVLWSNVDQKSKQLTDLIRGGMCLAQQQLQQSSDSLQSSSDRPSLSRHSSANGLGHQSSKHSSIFSQSNSGSAHSSSSSSSSITRAPFGVKPSPFRTDSLKFLSPEPSAPKSNGTNSWKDVYNNLPVMYAEAVLLIVSQLSFDTRVFLNMDVESRSGGIPHLLRSTSSSIRLNQSEFAESFVMTTEHDHAMKVLLDRISNLLQLLEQLRLHWPNDSCESINRLMFIMSHEVQRIHRLDDMCVPFLVPEVWDAWYMFVQVMMDFLGFIALLVKREAAYDDVQSRIGQVIVQVRFMEKIQHLQSSETSLFSRDLTLFV